MQERKYLITVKHVIDDKVDYAFEIVNPLPCDPVQLLAKVVAALDFQSADAIKRICNNPEFDSAIKREWENFSERLNSGH